MSISQPTMGFLLATAIVVAAGCNRAPEVLTPEAASAKGDALLREMSKNLSAIQTFAYTADERREEVKGATKQEKRVSRQVVVRRPNAFMFTSTGSERDVEGWYDGKHLTIVSNRAKVWARGPMPPTLDEALDFLSAEYAIQMPTADLLYSSPYDALMTTDTTGGWVDVQKVGERTCDHLAYRAKQVDWEIWLGEARRLPCQVKIVYKNDPGQPATTVTYGNFELSPAASDEKFAAKIPDGYQRIKIMRHATVNDPKVEAAPSDPPGKVAR
jgi:hypothetical protein